MFLDWLFRRRELSSGSPFVDGICERSVRAGCSREAADLVKKALREGRASGEEAAAAAEYLPCCSRIDELKERFAVTEEPAGKEKVRDTWKEPIFGAVYGDIIGSRYEGRRITDIDSAVMDPYRSGCTPTDDTVLTIATLCAVDASEDPVYYNRKMTFGDLGSWSGYPVEFNPYTQWYRAMAKKFPFAGYGSRFIEWIAGDDERPYGSFGNGSAMRVSPIGAWYNRVDNVIEQAVVSAMATHSHIEGVKGAVVTAVCIWMARKGYSKEQIFGYMKKHCSYGESSYMFSDFSYGEASGIGIHQVECAYSVPAAVISFCRSTDYMDAIRLSACVGYDTDTNACICGGIAGAYYGVPEDAVAVVTKMVGDMMGKNILCGSPAPCGGQGTGQENGGR